MAETIGTVTGTRKQSIARVELFTDAKQAPQDWQIVFHFEDGTYDEAGKLIGETEFGSRRVVRKFGDIQKESVSDGANTLTIAALAGLIKIAGYQFRAEDVKKEQAP